METQRTEYKLTEQDIMEELLPLLKDYFLAKVTFKSEGIYLSFLGDQTFRLSVERQ